MNDEFSVAACWQGRFDETALQQWAGKLLAGLDGKPVSLGLVFMSPDFFPYASQVLEILRVHAHIPLLAGCSSSGLICGDQELEGASGIALALYSLPGAKLKGVRFTEAQAQEADGATYWHHQTGVGPTETNGWLTFIDPYHFMELENWLRSWNTSYSSHPLYGGRASGNNQEQLTQIYLDGEVYEDGGVAISVGGDVKLTGVVSQGCTPIGDTWTLTRVDHNLIQQIANRPAYTVLAETFQKLPLAEQQKARGNLLIGLVMNEYLENYHRGDFLVRTLIGGDPSSGILAVGALPRPGQTIQFQRRDAVAASEDLREMLGRERDHLGGAPIYGGCLCCCNGRGKNLFGRANHDAGMVQQELGSMGLAGFFCNGEIGPVSGKNYLHSYTASLALFVKK
ncbi:MAG TPA: FIST N-terminal domain-containing protein [Verrucomicrobiae bacterium]